MLMSTDPVILYQDDYREALIKLHQTVTRAYQVSSICNVFRSNNTPL